MQKDIGSQIYKYLEDTMTDIENILAKDNISVINLTYVKKRIESLIANILELISNSIV